MAFWKKSEAPWDMEPRPVGTVSPAAPDRDQEPESLLDSLITWNEARKAEKARKEPPPPPIPCPWCGKEMEAGYIMGNRGIWWAPGRPGAWAKWAGAGEASGAVQVDTEGGLMASYRTAWVCRDCRKMTLNLPDAPDTPESRTQQEYEDELRGYAEQAKQREEEH